MGKTLVIVESPGKINKIQSILGADYSIMASYGHILDLDSGGTNVDIENNFTPKYSPISGRGSKIIKDIRNRYRDCDDLLIATDEDREGEMIAWSIAHVLNLKAPKRIVFNSITKRELLDAVKSPKKIDDNMVNAQKTRRILDRLVGFELSPLLWSNINNSAKSAGRVQSVVVRIIVDKENEIKEFLEKDKEAFFKFTGIFINKDDKLKANLFQQKKDLLVKPEINKEKDARNIMKSITKSEFKIKDTIKKESVRKPSAPFTTSTIQQEASRKLGMPVKRTMMAAQALYEGGYITYMRTDSTNLSDEAVKNIGDCVVKKFGEDNYQKTEYKSKSKNTQEAHEAIRPTDCSVETITNPKIGSDGLRLYNLIWRRSMASQMKPARYDVYTTHILISKLEAYLFVSQSEKLVFPGFLLVYNIKNEELDEDESEQQELKNIPKSGTILKVDSIMATQDFPKPPTRYGEASLVNKLDPKNLNIGRPSTYGTIINKILEREYVKIADTDGIEKKVVILSWDGKIMTETSRKIKLGNEKKKIVPTQMGIIVNDFLTKNFPTIMDYKFTADMEKDLDKIAIGKKIWHEILKSFYNEMHPIVIKLQKNIMTNKVGKVIGIHPEYDADIIASIGKFGPMISIKKSDKDIIRAPIREPLTIDTIKLEDAIELFKYPKNIGVYDGQPIHLYKSKLGFYIKCGDKMANLNELNCETITEEKAIKLLQDRNKNVLWSKTEKKTIYSIMDGPYGKYISVKSGTKKPVNIKINGELHIDKIDFQNVKKYVKDNLTKTKKKVIKNNG